MSSSGKGNRRKKNDIDDLWKMLGNEQRMKENVERMALPMIAGTMAFGAALAISTWTQGMVFGISTGTMAPIPSLAGMVSVATASMASHHASTSSFLQKHPQQILSNLQQQQLPSSIPCWSEIQSKAQEAQASVPRILSKVSTLDIRSPLSLQWDEQSVAHAVRVCLAGMLIYRGILGGRFWSISPSSYTNLGSFARRSLPATNDSYATYAQRQQIELLGRKFGCHTCGSRMIFAKSRVKFHADHMPPRSVVNAQKNQFWRKLLLPLFPIKQRFYPQCVNCSNKQGSLLGQATQQLRNAIKTKKHKNASQMIQPHFLTKAGGGRNAHFHGLRPRLSHLTGACIAAITVSPTIINNTNRDSQQINDLSAPFQNIQDIITDTAQTLISFIQSNFK